MMGGMNALITEKARKGRVGDCFEGGLAALGFREVEGSLSSDLRRCCSVA